MAEHPLELRSRSEGDESARFSTAGGFLAKGYGVGGLGTGGYVLGGFVFARRRVTTMMAATPAGRADFHCERPVN